MVPPPTIFSRADRLAQQQILRTDALSGRVVFFLRQTQDGVPTKAYRSPHIAGRSLFELERNIEGSHDRESNLFCLQAVMRAGFEVAIERVNAGHQVGFDWSRCALALGCAPEDA